MKAIQTISEIVRVLGRHSSTISRELKRGRFRRGYRAEQACLMSSERSQSSHNVRRTDTKVWADVAFYLGVQWSPEQIARKLGVTVRKDNTPENLSLAKKIALNLFRMDTTDTVKSSLRPKRKRAAWADELPARFLGFTTI